jgi:uncharacterized C2H2 Zn-finger protein
MRINLNIFKRNAGDNGIVKCKQCTMTFQDKERMIIHSRKAHTGREKPDSHH